MLNITILTKGECAVLKAIAKNERIKSMCLIGLIFLSLILTVVQFISYNPTTITMSSIGRANPTWFILWGITTAFAVYLNFKLFAEKLGIRSRLFDWTLMIASAGMIAQALINGTSPWEGFVHMMTAATFGVLGTILLGTMLIVKQKKHGYTIPHFVLLAISAACLVVTFFMMGFVALFQVQLIIVALIIVFAINFVENWAIVENKQAITGECKIDQIIDNVIEQIMQDEAEDENTIK